MAGEMENEDSSWDSQLPWFSLPVSRLNSELPPFLAPTLGPSHPAPPRWQWKVLGTLLPSAF